MSSISIVIPSFNHWHLTHSLLFDLYNFNHDVDEVLVVDDSSTDKDVIDGFQWWVGTEMLPVKWMELSENVGFLKACNKGVAESNGDIIILISNDVQIKRPILEEVRQKLESRKSVVGGRLLDWDTGWNTFDGKIFPYLEGWLLGFTREAWNDVGGFDEIYSPNDYEDMDISTKWISHGYALDTLDDRQIIHIGGQSIKFSPERESITRLNKEKFREKWIHVPPTN